MVREARGAAAGDVVGVVGLVVEVAERDSCWRLFCRLLDVPVLSVRW